MLGEQCRLFPMRGQASSQRQRVEHVSIGLLGARVGLQPVARQMLAAADRVAE